MNHIKHYKVLHFTIFYALFVCVVATPLPLTAEDASGQSNAQTNAQTNAEVQEAVSSWKSQAELGFVKTSGNTKTSSTNIKFDVTNEREKWRHNVHLEGYSTETDGITSAERYQFSEKSDYKFNEFDYLFFRTDYDKDRFGGFEYQATFSLGYGRRLLNKDTMTFDVEIGPGIRYSKVEFFETEKESLLRVAAKYNWDITESSKFTQELAYDEGEELTVSKSITTLQANIQSNLAMKLTHTVKHNSVVPLGAKKTDTETAVTLVYLF